MDESSSDSIELEVGPDEIIPKSTKEVDNTGRNILIFLGVVVVIIAVAIILAVYLPKPEDNPNDTNDCDIDYPDTCTTKDLINEINILCDKEEQSMLNLPCHSLEQMEIDDNTKIGEYICGTECSDILNSYERPYNIICYLDELNDDECDDACIELKSREPSDDEGSLVCKVDACRDMYSSICIGSSISKHSKGINTKSFIKSSKSNPPAISTFDDECLEGCEELKTREENEDGELVCTVPYCRDYVYPLLCHECTIETPMGCETSDLIEEIDDICIGDPINVHCANSCNNLDGRVGSNVCDSVYCAAYTYRDVCNDCSVEHIDICDDNEVVPAIETDCQPYDASNSVICTKACDHLNAIEGISVCSSAYCAEYPYMVDCCTLSSVTYCDASTLVSVVDDACLSDDSDPNCMANCYYIKNVFDDASLCSSLYCREQEPFLVDCWGDCDLSDPTHCTTVDLSNTIRDDCVGGVNLVPSSYLYHLFEDSKYLISTVNFSQNHFFVTDGLSHFTFNDEDFYPDNITVGRNTLSGENVYAFVTEPLDLEQGNIVTVSTESAQPPRDLSLVFDASSLLLVFETGILIENMRTENAYLPCVGIYNVTFTNMITLTNSEAIIPPTTMAVALSRYYPGQNDKIYTYLFINSGDDMLNEYRGVYKGGEVHMEFVRLMGEYEVADDYITEFIDNIEFFRVVS